LADARRGQPEGCNNTNSPSASGVGGGTGPVNVDQPYFDFQVEKPVGALPGSIGPRYPDVLRSGGIEGEVLAQFVVDTTGRIEVSTFRVLRSDHADFEQAVRSALPNMRFSPAEIGGRKVRQLVQQPFIFALQR
jgi:protein TonB